MTREKVQKLQRVGEGGSETFKIIVAESYQPEPSLLCLYLAVIQHADGRVISPKHSSDPALPKPKVISSI